jgi:hypothetical protein
MTAAMQEDFEEADDARVVDLDAGIAHRADGDRKSKALQQRHTLTKVSGRSIPKRSLRQQAPSKAFPSEAEWSVSSPKLRS